MRCEKCNVEIVCKTRVCPLCHERLYKDLSAINQIKKMERAFPQRPCNRPYATSYFNKVYLVMAINILLISIVANIIITPDVYWSLIVAGLLLYFYFFIRYTILRYSHFNSKVVGQAAFLYAIFILIQQVLDMNLWIYEFALPAIILVSTIAIAIYLLVNIGTAKNYLFSLFILAVLGILPIFIVLFTDAYYIWPSIVAAITSASILLTTIIAGRKTLLAEFKRKFHL
ncbi:MAG: DUF6320 domain-containing protein [Bacillota bacterium]|jgi:hypothetical protein|nr:DUF6320 domain-containing protein [Bacillota bacterium]HHU43955.1 hypothetical protein [Clostridiales bacterium]